MGSPLSPIADIVLQNLKEKALTLIPFQILFYFRYVDDIILTSPVEFADQILHIFNSFHPRLQFTVELAEDKRLYFLDVVLHINDDVFEFNWYHKPTFSGRYLNFASHHSLCQKIGTIYSLVDRAFLLSHPKYYKKISSSNFNR